MPKKSIQSVRQTIQMVCISIGNTLASFQSIATSIQMVLTSIRTVFASVSQLEVFVWRTAASFW